MKITLLIGLPGSGKTTYAHSISDCDTVILDDVKYNDIPKDIEAGHLIFTNPNMCEQSYKDKYIRKIKHLYPVSKTKEIYFENNPELCLENALRREREKTGNSNYIELSVERLAKVYTIPDQAEIIPVFDDGSSFKPY